LACYALDQLQDIEQSLGRLGVAPSEHSYGRSFDPRAPTRVNTFARHQVDLGSEDILHALLQGDEIEEGKATGPIKIEKHVDVRGIAGGVDGNRPEQEQPTDSGVAKLRLVLSQQRNDLVTLHL